ncbi:HipA domain-containing protein [Acidobacteria bacterium AH-259-D05]|nr:HipA domain-containing protein [Acidobacteria bacterium AH-259-D05]
MTRCPITYERLDEGRYSLTGLRRLSSRLEELEDFPYTAEEQVREAQIRASKMSIQGVQPKLSARLSVAKRMFEVIDTGGRYILKPQNPLYRELPENEDLSMRLASNAGIEVPLHGLVYSKDGSLTYFIRRFDRQGRRKVAVEDFAQLAGLSRDTKYNFSMERLVPILEEHCTFPAIEKLRLFRLTLFNYLIGNEDAHLKNFSLIRRGDKIELSPAYDLVNTTIALEEAQEEMALPLMGKKRKFTRDTFFGYFARERLELSDQAIKQVEKQFTSCLPEWVPIIDVSFLSPELKDGFRAVVEDRRVVLEL